MIFGAKTLGANFKKKIMNQGLVYTGGHHKDIKYCVNKSKKNVSYLPC